LERIKNYGRIQTVPTPKDKSIDVKRGSRAEITAGQEDGMLETKKSKHASRKERERASNPFTWSGARRQAERWTGGDERSQSPGKRRPEGRKINPPLTCWELKEPMELGSKQ